MLSKVTKMSFVAGVLMAAVSLAQAPAGAPAGSTGLCKDGSYWTGPTKKGACRGHHGVQDWYAAPGTATSGAAPSTAPAAATAATAATAAAPAAAAPAAAAPAMTKASAAPAATAAPGGGPGQVWANKNSKVYHCSGDRWYGKTKNGAYMTEAEATAQGYRPDHGKACH